MKKVMTPSQVCHTFANKLQSEAYTPTRHLFFNSNGLWSYGYHFCIAKHVTNNEGLNGLLFTIRSYSNTTAKHINEARHATSHLNKIYCPFPNEAKERNFGYWLNIVENIASNLPKAKKPEIYLNKIEQVKNEVQRYCAFFNINLELAAPVLFEALKITSKDIYKGYHELKIQAQEKAKTIREKELKKKLNKEIKEFRAFERARIYNRLSLDYLRFNTESKRVETSQGVEVPELIARKFYTYVLETIKTGGCNQCNTKILDFEVTEINKAFIRVGCHKIEIKEIQKLVKNLNW